MKKNSKTKIFTDLTERGLWKQIHEYAAKHNYTIQEFLLDCATDITISYRREGVPARYNATVIFVKEDTSDERPEEN